jgi:dolichol-phosphate mannosyltransferase
LLQPAFLATLVYRFGPPGLSETDPHRVMANGQCFLMRRSVLEDAGGYVMAADSYCDDIRIARHLAARGARVGFLDGRLLLDVVMYRTGGETWRAWPRSLNMRDATTPRWRLIDAVFLLLAQGLPLAIVVGVAASVVAGAHSSWLAPLAAVNAMLLGVRLLFNVAISRSFARRGAPFWLSPFADLAAVLRVVETIVRHPREWRGVPRLEPARR